MMGRLYGREHFVQVAHIYAAAQQNGTKTVAEQFGVTRSTAAKWIYRCRRPPLELLPATRQGRGARLRPTWVTHQGWGELVELLQDVYRAGVLAGKREGSVATFMQLSPSLRALAEAEALDKLDRRPRKRKARR